MNYVFYIFFSWFFIYLTEERHFTVLSGGFYAGLPWFAAAFGSTIGGELCDRLCRRLGPRWGCRAPAMAGLTAAAGLLYFGAVAPDPLVAIALLSVCFGCIEVTEGPFWAAQTYVAREHTPAATGVLNTGGNLGGVICSPVIPILVHEFGWIPALASGSLVALFAAALWLFIRVDRPFEADFAPASAAVPGPVRATTIAP
jgi:ACS family glucarate transporter-like MFS transporter